MNKVYIMAALALATMPLAAQETYENAKIAAEDLNGTARYVGMGGAMEALGADISTISTNPAGIGLCRRSSISASFGLVSQEGVDNVLGANKTNVSFDQAGFVWATRTDRSSFINIAFNYHKSRNFNFILSAANGLNNASLNKLTWAKALTTANGHADGYGGLLYEQKSGEPTVVKNGNNEEELNYVPDFNRPYITCNQLDELFAPELNYGGGSLWEYYNAKDYVFDRAHEGYISEYDINISGNINDRVYLGMTVGLHDVHYKHNSEYTEAMAESNDWLSVVDNREITGWGFDLKFGGIARPVEDSPFRIGVSVSTPTFYTLTTSNYTYLTDGRNTVDSKSINDAFNRGRYKFKLYTPWKFGASLGHTIGSEVALGLSYEYADYGTMDTRYITDDYYDYRWDGYYTRSESDKVMNQHTKQTLKGVHTLKIGGEYKPMPEMALRLGYNYVSPMYAKDGYKDGTLNSDASYISSATDYTNWKDTHRITCGFGYSFDNFNVSLAYQYSITKGEFKPFMSYEDYNTPDFDNIASETKVSNKRHQVICTLNYNF